MQLQRSESRDFSPLLYTDVLQILQVSGMSLGNMDFQLPPKIFYWVQVWRLARPVKDAEMLLMEPRLGCASCVFWVVVMLENPATIHLQCSYWGKEVVGQSLTIHSPMHPPLNTVQSSCPLCRKISPKNDVSTSTFTGEMVFLSSYSSFVFIQPRQVEFRPKSAIFVSSDHMTFSQSSSGSSRWTLANFRQAWTCTGWSRGTLCAQQDFNPWWCSVSDVLVMVFFADCGPNSLQVIYQVLPCSSGLIPHLPHNHWCPTRWDLPWSPKPRETDRRLELLPFLIIVPTAVAFPPSC